MFWVCGGRETRSRGVGEGVSGRDVVVVVELELGYYRNIIQFRGCFVEFVSLN